MNRREFLTELEMALTKLPGIERAEIIEDFEEHFANGLNEGKTEEEISAALGKPQQIGKELSTNYHIEKAETLTSTGNIIRAVWAVIGLGFFNLVIVLGPFIALLGVIFAGWTTGVAFVVSPLLLLINFIIFPDVVFLFELFISLILCGLGIFICIGMYYTTRTILKWFIKYLKFNADFVKGGMKNE